MRIVADENIPFAREAFGQLGDVTLAAGRLITPGAVRDAELLFVRSVTRVDAALLTGSRVRFVATATIGTDHVDTGYLASQGISFAYAPGSNANSVAEYVTAALLVLAGRKGWTLAGRSIGIVGAGNVGSAVARKAGALGMRALRNDPPLARGRGPAGFVELAQALDADIVTLHVPLTKSGPDRTFHLVNGEFLARMRPDATLINTSRGAVTDTSALLESLARGRPGAVVLDVWEGEPAIDVELLSRTDIATAHIAGYSFDGKVNGTHAIYKEACKFLGRKADWDPRDVPPPPDVGEIDAPADADDEGAIAEVVRRVYAIERDDAHLRDIIAIKDAGARARHFDELRRTYAVRREFHNTVVRVPERRRPLAKKLAGLGFRVEDATGPIAGAQR
ncbi:MAG: 4-phosphoerythronate dehydrogenase [Planctomycetota bacterium]